MLLFDAFGQMRQIPHGAFDLAMGRLQLARAHQRCGARQTPAGTVGDGDDHRQIPQQFLGWSWRLRRDLLMGFQKQFGRIQNPLAYRRGCVAPGRVEFAGLAAVEAVLRKRIGHALAVLGVGARHRRQILHGDMRGDLASTDALLHGFRKLFHQSQSAGDPAHAAIKSSRQIVQAITETLLHLLKQPALFQCRLLFGKTHRPVQDQRVGFAHVPDHGFDRIATQLLQSRHAFVAVDHQISTRTPRYGNDHDRRLLSGCRQRCHQPPLPVRMPRPADVHTGGPVDEIPASFPVIPTRTDSRTGRIWSCTGLG